MYGDEPFLKQLVIDGLRDQVLESDTDVPYTTFEGDSVIWRDVLDELSTRALFGGSRRLVRLAQADSFVSKNRPQLEDYVERPVAGSVLLLEVGAWPSNTRLYKSIGKTGMQIECRPPQRVVGRSKKQEVDEQRLLEWLAMWSQRHHDAHLTGAAADLLLELVGPKMGLLDQELAKLALFAGRGGKITTKMVRDVTGGWHTKTIWELVDAAADGNAAEAMRQLDQLMQSGTHPLALFGPVSWSLRRFAAATRIVQQAERSGQRVSLPAAMQQAGFWKRDQLQRNESQLKQLGRHRAGRLYHWLLETDLALKGTHSLPPRARMVLERLIVRLSRQASNTGAPQKRGPR